MQFPMSDRPCKIMQDVNVEKIHMQKKSTNVTIMFVIVLNRRFCVGEQTAQCWQLGRARREPLKVR